MKMMRMVLVRLVPLPLALAALAGFSSGIGQEAAESSPGDSMPLSSLDDALVVLSTLDLTSFDGAIAAVRESGGEVPQAYPPNALVATLNPQVELALSQLPAVARIERGVVDPASLTALGGQAEVAAHIWNTAFRGVPDPIAAAAPPVSPPERQAPDIVISPAQAPGQWSVPAAPTNTQTSEFMAGTVVVSVVFVESSGAPAPGNCSPGDPNQENWTGDRQNTVLAEIGEGLVWWTARSGRPSPLTFLLDNLGTWPTSCEPINRTFDERGLWIADVLTAMGFPATPSNYDTVARSFVNARRTAFPGADWGFVIFVVDSEVDGDGIFADGIRSAWGELNGPTQGLTYDNGPSYGIANMDRVCLHETGHIFGALDEYPSLCSPTDSFGYLNVPNTSCNNGGDTSDISVMGEYEELMNREFANVSTSARGAIGWRNPALEDGRTVVDVVRTSTVSLTPYTPDPTYDNTPTYSATAGNVPFPPAGPRIYLGWNYGTAAPVTVSRVEGAQWRLNVGPFTSAGIVPTDGAFDEETEPYTFTPPGSLPNGTYNFGTRSINNFGNRSSIASDTLTITSADSDGDGFTDAVEAVVGTDPLDACPDNSSDDAWPPDLNGGSGCGSSHNGTVNILDVLCFKGKLAPDPYNARYDLNQNPPAGVNILDVLVLKPFMGTSCTNP